MLFEHVRVRNSFGETRILSEMEEEVLNYLLTYTQSDKIQAYLLHLDDQFYEEVGENPDKDTNRLLMLMKELEYGVYLLDDDWVDTLFTYVMKINRYHTTYEF